MAKSLVYDRLGVESLSTFDGNPRRGAVDQIAKSLEKHGQYRPIVVNAGTLTGRRNEVLAGNHTLLAARSLGWSLIDAAIVDVDEARAIMLTESGYAEYAESEPAISEFETATADFEAEQAVIKREQPKRRGAKREPTTDDGRDD